MSVWEIIVGIVLILLSIVIIGVVLLQEGRQANLGAINGAADAFMEKGRARTLDAVLSRWTKVIMIVFFVLVFAGMLVTRYLPASASSSSSDTSATTTTTAATTTTTTTTTAATTTAAE